MQTVRHENTNVTSVSVLSPQKSGPGIEMPESNLGLLSRRRSSVPSSRPSRRRTELEAQIMEEKVRAQIENSKSWKFDTSRQTCNCSKQMELEARKEAMKLSELKKQKDLAA